MIIQEAEKFESEKSFDTLVVSVHHDLDFTAQIARIQMQMCIRI